MDINTRLDYIEKNIEKTEIALNKRLEGMNEFRAALKDQNSTFITRVEFDARYKLIEEKIETLQKAMWILIGMLIIVETIIRFI